jgi:threo-3-hydroxy-L-aspartate ammonia-lyase
MDLRLADVEQAAARLAPIVHRTPVLRSRQLDAQSRAQVFLKAECLQRTGSFKIRGAYNMLSQVDPARRARGVVSYSSGNHAQGVALAAQLLGAPATLFVPATIPAAKRAATAGYGAEMVTAGTTSADREVAALAMARERDLVVVKPYDDPAIMAGQGTVALELCHDVPDLDYLVAPIGGGGLMAGCCIAGHGLAPRLQIVGVEADDANDTYLSLQAGQRVQIAPPQTIADGMRALVPGELTFEVMRTHLAAVALVSDAEIVAAMRFLLERMKILVEPTGAVGVAALLQGRIPAARGRRVGVVLSGGNIDLVALGGLLAAG